MVNYLNSITPITCPNKPRYNRMGAQRMERFIWGLGEGFPGEVAYELSLTALTALIS